PLASTSAPAPYAPIVVWCGRPARMVERGARNGLEVSQRREAASVAGPAISGTGPAQVRAGPWASSAVGSYPVSAAAVAIAACNSCHWRWNKLQPSASQRCTSASTLASVKGSRLARSDSKTLTRMLRLYAPAAVLLVRPALRSKAALRCRRSVALLVGATSGCSTNVNNSSSNSRCISSLTRLAKSRSWGFHSGDGSCQCGRHSVHRRPSNSAYRLDARPGALPGVFAAEVDALGRMLRSTWLRWTGLEGTPRYDAYLRRTGDTFRVVRDGGEGYRRRLLGLACRP